MNSFDSSNDRIDKYLAEGISRILDNFNLDRRTGICKFFLKNRGWGFITPDDGGQDIFVHQSVIFHTGFRCLDEGDHVEVVALPSSKGHNCQEALLVCGIGGVQIQGHVRRRQRRPKLRRCYNCWQLGTHTAARCPMGPLQQFCHDCGAPDHFCSECPLRLHAVTALPLNCDQSTQTESVQVENVSELKRPPFNDPTPTIVTKETREINVRFIKFAKPSNSKETPKSVLYKESLDKFNKTPEYITLERPKDRHFKTIVRINDYGYTTPYWEVNKRTAEQSAAMACLSALGWDV